MIRVTVYAGAGENDERGTYEPSTVTHFWSERDVSEELRKLGLEWRQADYFPTRQTVITFDPMPDEEAPDARQHVRNAAEALRRSGLL